jgi:predicted O-methyltransferase YrrM
MPRFDADTRSYPDGRHPVIQWQKPAEGCRVALYDRPMSTYGLRTIVGRAIHTVLTVPGEYPTRRYSAHAWLTGTGWVPSHQAKRRHLRGLFRERGHSVFIEAGTYRGDTVAALVGEASKIVSVELDEHLYRAAAERFAAVPSVDIRFGDATDLIPEVVAECSPALVFLDGHFSGPGTALGDEVEPAIPILTRLAAVSAPGTTVVVDDLRLFGSAADYPQLDELTARARAAFPSSHVRVGLDCLVIET